MNYLGFRTRKQNKFIMRCALTVAVLGIGVAAFFVSKAVEDNRGYRTIGVVETKGNVTVVKDGIDYKAYPGMHLQEGHILVTAGESSARLVLDGDKYIKVESGSRVVFETLGLWGSGKTKIVLERGSMTGELVNPLETGQEFVVNTPNAVLAVRGTFFRVELQNYGIREVRTNVLTYGGAVAAKRIFPTGETEDEEVLVESGYKTAIHMDAEDTFYVLEKTEGAKDTTGDNNNDIEPIYWEEIADDDWVDIYYSAENGHELFVTSEEAKKEIEDRNISLENITPIYEKAAEIFPETEETTDSGVETAEQMLNALPDDSKALAMAEIEQDTDSEGLIGNDIYFAKQELQSGLLTDGSSKEDITEEPGTEENIETMEETPITEEMVEEDTDETKPADGVQAENEVMEPDSTVNENTGNEEIGGDSQDSGAGGTADGSVGNAGSGNGGNTGGNAGTGGSSGGTGTGSGGTSGSGSGSGGTHTHTEEYVGSETVHSKCSTCGETLSTTHEYTDRVTKAASCNEEGILQYACVCGYSYEKPIDATGHTPVYGGEAGVHRKCDTCGEVLEDGTAHDMVEINRTDATCTSEGRVSRECNCGYEEIETLEIENHQYDSSTNTCSTCNQLMIEIDNNIFPDEAFRTYVMQYDTNNDYYLYNTEMTQVSEMVLPEDTFESLQGIEYFSQLLTLVCANNPRITSLDLSALDNLRALDISGCTGIKNLNISYTDVTGIDLSGFTQLQELNVSRSKLFVLNVDGLNSLTRIDAVNCEEMTSISAQNCTSLTYADVAGSSLNGAWFNDCTSLGLLNLSNSTALSQVYFRNCSSLSVVDVTNSGSSFGNCILYGKDSKITSQEMITGFDSSYMTYYATE